MRRPLMFLLTLGVIFGFGSGFAQLHRWRHGGCNDWRDGRWSDARYGSDWRTARDFQPEVKAPAATPQTVVVQPSAPAAAPAPQVFVIMPQGVATPQVVTVPVAATPAPGGNVAPPATAP